MSFDSPAVTILSKSPPPSRAHDGHYHLRVHFICISFAFTVIQAISRPNANYCYNLGNAVEIICCEAVITILAIHYGIPGYSLSESDRIKWEIA
ncbi:hypothetical protein TNCT_199841 [Trichonephila clavata]|uniref:Uncharacterized protein n=1 Tax=Trichonephila clavata TaxID=2740835 RepID=A0A8X6LGE7_TRICU|nr:hypothetical protein TNCT_199841 [Trichonephila clavata]